MPKIVLLTGATGYIAKHIALQLVEAGYHVRGTVRDLSRGAEVMAAVRPHLTDATDLDTRLTFVTLDLKRDDGWADAMAGVDVLMHTASPFPMVQPSDENDVIRPAVDGALRALRAAQAAGVSRVIMTSSTAAISGSPLPVATHPMMKQTGPIPMIQTSPPTPNPRLWQNVPHGISYRTTRRTCS